MLRTSQMAVIAWPVTARTLCATTPFFYNLLGRAQDLDLHGLTAERALEVPDLGVGFAQVTGRHDVLMGLHRRRRPRLREPLPAADHAGREVQLATELGHRLLPRHDPLNRGPLEVRAEYPPAVCLRRCSPMGPPGACYVPTLSSPDGEHSTEDLRRLYNAWCGLSWWRIMKGNTLPAVDRTGGS
jgi:hypothetical protein